MRILHFGESAADSEAVRSALQTEYPDCSLLCVDTEPAFLVALDNRQSN